jgi:hypothetical protein
MTTSEPAAEPQVPNADHAWDEAFLRVESYLRAYGLESAVLLNQITAQIIQEAQARSRNADPGEPIALAMAVTHAHIGAWFTQMGCEVDWSNEQTRAQGRLALIIAGLPGTWASHFLSSKSAPADLGSAMASFQLLAGPRVSLSNMAPEPLEFGILDPGDLRFPAVKLWLPARAMATWFLIFGFFGIAWAASH